MKPLPCLVAAVALVTSATAAPVLLNEYNAIQTAPPGVVGGDWLELVVVGAGIAGDVVDMRGWNILIQESGAGGGSGNFRLSNNPYWASVQAGTILTFHENNLAGGGRDTSILGTNNFMTEGWAHTNIFVGDTTYIDQGFGGGDTSFPMTENGMRITVQKAGFNIFGPGGESVFTPTQLAVGNDEVFKLEGTPSPLITPTSSLYNDGSSSTFGSPNEWTDSGVPNRQNFSAFIVPEPGSALLLGAAAVGLLSMRRRRS